MPGIIPQHVRIITCVCGILFGSLAWQSHAASNTQHVYLPVIAAPLPARFDHIKAAQKHGGFGYVEGEVINNIGRPLYNLTIEATYVSVANPNLITTTTTITAFPAILPGQSNAFYSDEPEDISANWRFDHATVTGWESASTHDYSTATVVRAGLCASGAGFCVELRNDYQRTLQDITILLGYPIYPYAYDWQKMSEPLAPGKTQTYHYTLPYDWSYYVVPTQIWAEAQGELVP